VDFSKQSSLAVLLISLLVLSSFVAIGQEGSNPTGTTVLATVNGNKITRQELTRASQVQRIVMSLSRQYRTFAQFLMSSNEGQDFLEEYRKHVLDQLINQEITKQKIEELSITVSDEAVQSEITKIIEGNKQFSNKSDLENYLKKNQKMSMADLKSRIKQNLKAQKLRGKVTDKVTVSEEEIKSFYESNKKNYTDKQGNVTPLKEVKGQIEDTLKSRKQNKAYSEWLKETRKKADVEKNPDKL